MNDDENLTLSDCFDRYEREVVPTFAPRTQADYHRYLKTLRAWCGHMRPQDLEPRDIGQFLDVPKGKIHRNRMVSVLSSIYQKIVGKWYIRGCTVNPCRDVERNKAYKRTRYVTDAEYSAVWNYMPEKMRIAMDLALITGQRQGDLLTLRWESVSPEGVLFTPAKNRLIRSLSY